MARLTRKAVLNTMYGMAYSMYGGKYSKQTENAIWRIASDWNSEHPDEEIFMGEYSNSANRVDGFCIEDDYFLYSDMEGVQA